MSTGIETAHPSPRTACLPASSASLPASKLNADLRLYFGVDFAVWDGETGQCLRRGLGQPPGDELLQGCLVQAVARKAGPQLIGYEDFVVVLAIPWHQPGGACWVAVAMFATGQPGPGPVPPATLRLLGFGADEAARWLHRQSVWTPESLLRVATALLDKLAAERDTLRLEAAGVALSQRLDCANHELQLLVDLIRHLSISSSEETLGRLALSWLQARVPAEAVAIQYLPVARPGSVTYKARTETLWLSAGRCPIGSEALASFVRELDLRPEVNVGQDDPAASGEFAPLAAQCGSNGAAAAPPPFMATSAMTARADWPLAGVRQLIVAPLVEGPHVFGWLAACNHTRDEDFGSAEMGLLRSVGVLLGIHSGNRELYRQQAEFLADVVRAMTSAIDAKDRYTCGHSDRVAHFAVLLARVLGWTGDQLSTIYMAGLLHDIGKIGIDERVLRKPEPLTEQEYQQVKLHPQMGYKILSDVRSLSGVLPAVLYHHEQWDGGGYPEGLSGASIPQIARIVAVADAYDAMTSDRPYRQGMPPDLVRQVFQEGTGIFWDPEVVEAFCHVEPEFHGPGRRPRPSIALDVHQWL